MTRVFLLTVAISIISQAHAKDKHTEGFDVDDYNWIVGQWKPVDSKGNFTTLQLQWVPLEVAGLNAVKIERDGNELALKFELSISDIDGGGVHTAIKYKSRVEEEQGRLTGSWKVTKKKVGDDSPVSEAGNLELLMPSSQTIKFPIGEKTTPLEITRADDSQVSIWCPSLFLGKRLMLRRYTPLEKSQDED